MIAQYCHTLGSDYDARSGNGRSHHEGIYGPKNPAQVISAIELNQRDELESIIHELEEENRLESLYLN